MSAAAAVGHIHGRLRSIRGPAREVQPPQRIACRDRELHGLYRVYFRNPFSANNQTGACREDNSSRRRGACRRGVQPAGRREGPSSRLGRLRERLLGHPRPLLVALLSRSRHPAERSFLLASSARSQSLAGRTSGERRLALMAARLPRVKKGERLGVTALPHRA